MLVGKGKLAVLKHREISVVVLRLINVDFTAILHRHITGTMRVHIFYARRQSQTSKSDVFAIKIHVWPYQVGLIQFFTFLDKWLLKIQTRSLILFRLMSTAEEVFRCVATHLFDRAATPSF
jgi:hypothetical protein